MQFPKAILDKDKYLHEVSELLNSDDVTIFIDTNIFGLYYRLFDTAREEFKNWMAPLIKKEQIKVPAWVLYEYSKRFVNGGAAEYLGAGKSLTTIIKSFAEIKRYLAQRIESSNATFHSDLQLIEKTLGTIAKEIGVDKDHINSSHVQLEELFQSCVLDSNIPDFLKKVQDIYKIRYDNKIPPGYEDDPQVGDLIIWQELLQYSSVNEKKRVIFLTNDNKKDWMYVPQKVIENSRTIHNSLFRIADPRLDFEFKLATGSNEFYIINTETLVKLLFPNNVSKFKKLAEALQLDTVLNTNVENPVEPNIVSEPLVTYITKKDMKEKESNYNFSREDMGLPNSGYLEFLTENGDLIFDSPPIFEILYHLENSDWYGQNDAINKLYRHNFFKELDEKDSYTKSALFFLGIGIYQSASSGGWGAINFMDSLSDIIPDLPEFVVIYIVAGLLYEIYFNSQKEFRSDNLKTSFAKEIFILQEEPKAKHAFNFISRELQPYESKILEIPSDTPKKVEIKIEHTKDPAHRGEVYVINRISSGEKQLAHSIANNRQKNDLNGDEQKLKKRIGQFFGYPEKDIDIIFSPNISNAYFKLNETLSLGINKDLQLSPISDDGDDLPF